MVISYTLTDATGAFVTGTLTVTVGANSPPVGVADSAAVAESGVNPGNTAFAGTPSASGNVLANDTDPDAADTKTVALVNGLAGNVGNTITTTYGTINIAANGTYTYTLDNSLAATQALAQGQVATEVITYRVRDTAGLFSDTTLTVTVNGTNDAPVAVADAATTALNVPLLNINVKGNDTDVDNTAAQLAVSAPTVNPAQGSVTLNADGTINFTPASGVTGPVTITYTLTDSFGASTTGTLQVNVGGINTPPVAVNDSASTVQNTAVTIAAGTLIANDTDADGNPLTITSVQLPTNGTVALVAGSVVFTPTPGYTGTASFDYTINDGQGGTSTATVNVTVTAVVAVNNPPVAVPDSNAVVESGVNPGNIAFAGTPSATGNVLTNDTDPDALDTKAVSAVNGSAANVGAVISGTYGSVQISADGSYTYTLDNARPATQALAQGQAVSEVFSYVVRDAAGATSSTTLTINVTGTNDAPLANADSNAVVESGVNPGNIAFPGTPSASGNVLSNDTDPDAADTKAVNAVNGSAANVGSTITGTYGTVNIAANGSYTYTLDNARPATQALTQGQVVSEVFNYNLKDALGAVSNTTTLTISVTGTNDAPLANADSNAVVESGVNPGNVAFAGTPSATGNVLTNDTDPDAADTKTVNAVNGLAANVGAVISGTYGSVRINADGSYTYTLDNTLPATQALAQGQVVSEVFNYNLNDTAGATSSSTLTITVTGTNDAPVAVNDTAPATNEDIAITIPAASLLGNDTDVENDPLTITSVQGATNGSVALVAGNIVFTPGPGYSGPASFTYTVSDGQGGSATATVDIKVNPGPRIVISSPDDVPGLYSKLNPLVSLPLFTKVADPALFVSFSVDDSRSQFEFQSGSASLQTDSVTLAELTNGLRSDLTFAEGNQIGSKGLGGQRSNESRLSTALFVQHAVRHQELGTEHGLFVQDSVRSSQLESLARDLKVNSFNSAVTGVTTLFDPFALGAPSSFILVESAAPAKESETKTSMTSLPSASSSGDISRTGENAEKAIESDNFGATTARAPLRRAADGFAAQLRRSATDFRPRMLRTENFGNGTIQTMQASTAQRKPM